MNMTTSAGLEELAQYVQAVVPSSKSIAKLQIKEDIGAVEFQWQGHEFIVKPTFETLELRNKKLYVTGASLLLQMVLMKRKRNGKLLESVVSAMEQSVDFLKNPLNQEKGFTLLRSVKQSLQNLRA